MCLTKCLRSNLVLFILLVDQFSDKRFKNNLSEKKKLS